MKFKPLTIDEVKFNIKVEEEDYSFMGEFNNETEDWIEKELESGNIAAWCYVVVEASWNRFKGSDSVGGCSYKSMEDLIGPDGISEFGMKQNAVASLNEECQRCLGDLLSHSVDNEES